MSRLAPAVALTLALAAGPVFAQGFGNVKGRVLLKGKFDAPKPLIAEGAATKDPTICAAKADIPDPGLQVDENGGIANAFVYLLKTPDTIHPNLAAVPKEPLLQDQKDCIFTPHSLVVRVGQGVNVTSQDGCAHNTHTNPILGKAVNFLLPANPKTPTFVETPQAEPLPIKVNCDIHPWMSTYWLIVDHPYATVTKPDGSFEIKNLPAGTHDIRLWHEKAGYLEKSVTVQVKAGETAEMGDFEYRQREFK